MHLIDTSNLNLRTDLIIEQENFENEKLKVRDEDDISISTVEYEGNNFTTIAFQDVTDSDNFKKVQKVFVREVKKYLSLNEEDTILVIGLGNSNSTPDSLGPKVLDNILVTRHLFLLGDVETNYSNVCKFAPSVTGDTGIETKTILKSVIKESKATKVIIIDSLKASKVERLQKIIQITNNGINPGSGINNDRGEISKRTMNVDVVAIGVPTVVDVKTIVEDLLEEEVSLRENLIVTPTNVDFVIERLGLLIGNGLNMALHKDFKRQNNY